MDVKQGTALASLCDSLTTMECWSQLQKENQSMLNEHWSVGILFYVE